MAEAQRQVAAPAGYAFKLPIKNDGALKLYLKKMIGVEVPDVKCCPHHRTPYEALRNAFFGVDETAIWLASRALGGKSWELATLAWLYATAKGADVNILGGSGEQSKNELSHLGKFWTHYAAKGMQELLRDDPTRSEQRLVYGNMIKALMASQTSVRGPHPQLLLLDELDEMRQDIFEAALGQPLPEHNILPQTIGASTRQYTDGTMAYAMELGKEKGWGFYEWCYRESMGTADFDWVRIDGKWRIKFHEGERPATGWLHPATVEATRNRIPDAMWQAEFECNEPSPESRAIMPDAVRAMFRRELGEFKGAIGEAIEIEQPTPGARYSTGADWAKKKDYTVIATYRTDTRPRKLVAFIRLQREEWPAMIAEFDKRVKRYGGACAHDATGIGDVVGDVMKSKPEDVILTGRTKSDMLTEYVSAVEAGEYECPFIDFMEAEHRMASRADLYSSASEETGRHHLPDSICAAALAHYALSGGVHCA